MFSSHLEPDQSRETNRRLPGDGWTWPSLINNWVVLRVDDQSLPRVKQTFYLGLWRIFKYEMFGDRNVESFNWYDNRISLLNISIFIRRKSQACKCLYSNGDDGPNDGESVDLGLLYRNSEQIEGQELECSASLDSTDGTPNEWLKATFSWKSEMNLAIFRL